LGVIHDWQSDYVRPFTGDRTNGDASRKGRKGRKGFLLEKLSFFFATFALETIRVAVVREDFTTDGTNGTDKERPARIHFQSV
jgi:hypothetical protein